MALRNREGTPVDPVPFLVVAALCFLMSFSFGPVYGLTLGLSLSQALVGSGVVFVATSSGAYHRLVWTARPDLRGEVPPEYRLQRLFYAIIALALVLLLIFLPLVWYTGFPWEMPTPLP